ncbi:MAG TPA: DUF4349 domain-containing protein [Ignavibacteria bacterium]|nr:DUF4349 domain-containing protein [Ignavibacteria bacterium]
MKYFKIALIIVILPYIASFMGCQDADKQPTEQTERNLNVDIDAPPTTSGENLKTAPKMDMGLTDSKSKEDDGSIQRINYQQPTDNFNTQDKRMIIRSGTMNLEADNFNDTESKIKQIVNNVNGYVTNSTSQINASGKKQGSITIRVASGKFDEMIGELGKIGKVVNQNISGKDVTEEYMDAEARQKTQRELEARLLKLLAEKTARLTDVVEVEQKLASVRENIEKTEGRMRYLKDQAAYSTLTVSVFEPSILNTSTGGGFFYELGESISKGLTGFTKVLSGIIIFIIAFSPILAIVLVGVYFIRRYLRKKKLVQAS